MMLYHTSRTAAAELILTFLILNIKKIELLWFGRALQPCQLPSQSSTVHVNLRIVKPVTVV